MAGFNQFQIDIAQPMEAVLKRHLDRKTARAAQPNGGFDVEVPLISGDPPPALKPDERFAVDAFQGFIEISETLERLLDIEQYVRRFPYRGTRVTRERYLRFHVEAYLHESYILRERLQAFAKRTMRAYKKGAQQTLASAIGKRLDEIVAALDDITRVRGRHVHESRFDETRLRNLGSLELIERNSSDEIWTKIIKSQYPKVRNYWARWVRNMNEYVGQLLDAYFDTLHPLMFEDHQFRAPHATR